MTAKTFLQQYRKAERRLSALDDQLEALHTKMEKIGGAPDNSPVMGGYWGDKLAGMVEAYQAQELAQQAERAACENTMFQVRMAISDVPDSDQRSLLEFRYLFGKDWRWIAEQLRYGEDHVRGKFHRKALDAVDMLKASK